MKNNLLILHFLNKVYYVGTSENEWNNIVIDQNNSILLNATCYYYSETEPTTSGNFWHYVDDVVTEWPAV